MDDSTFDKIQDRLMEIDPDAEVLKQTGAPAKGAIKIVLPVFMGSLQKIKDSSSSILKKFNDEEFYISDKLDGISALFVSDKKELYSRGNGEIGSNLSHVLQYIQGIPKNVPKKSIVRGELIMTRDDFKKEMGANARNAVSGIVNSKHPKPELANKVQFIAYSLMYEIGGVMHTVKDGLHKLEALGFTTPYNKLATKLEFEDLTKLLEERRKTSPFEVDGLVLSLNKDNEIEKKKNPSYAFAFKVFSSQETADVVVTSVDWNVSKDGLLKPVVLFEPVNLSGVNISRATGFNAEYIKTNGIGKGALITITRSGDVIPHILNTKRSAAAPQMPSQDFVWVNKDAKMVGNSSEQQKKELVNFFKVIEIEGLGPGLISKIYDAGFKTIKDIVKCTSAQFIAIQGFANKIELYEKIKKKINNLGCVELMHASNVFGPGFGTRKLESIICFLGAYPTDAITHKVLMEIPGVSEITAANFLKGWQAFKKFKKDANISCDESFEKKKQGAVSTSWIIVFTGIRDKQLESDIEAMGVKIGTSISKNTTLLVAKDVATETGKVKQAKALNVRVVSYDDFRVNYKSIL